MSDTDQFIKKFYKSWLEAKSRLESGSQVQAERAHTTLMELSRYALLERRGLVEDGQAIERFLENFSRQSSQEKNRQLAESLNAFMKAYPSDELRSFVFDLTQTKRNYALKLDNKVKAVEKKLKSRLSLPFSKLASITELSTWGIGIAAGIFFGWYAKNFIDPQKPQQADMPLSDKDKIQKVERLDSAARHSLSLMVHPSLSREFNATVYVNNYTEYLEDVVSASANDLRPSILDKWSTNLPYFSDIAGMQDRYNEQMKDTMNAEFVQNWLSDKFDCLKGEPTEVQLQSIDDIIDREIAYVQDSITYKKDDYCATPFETLMNKQGDCEDFAVLKAEACRYVGIAEENIGLALVTEHMFMVAKTSAVKGPQDWVVLNNDGAGYIQPLGDTEYKSDTITVVQNNKPVVSAVKPIGL